MLSKNKKRFMCYELALLSINAALSTRNKTYPIYKADVQDNQKKIARNSIREVLVELESEYSKKMPDGKQHIKYISKTAKDLTETIGDSLHNGEFRVGIAQKLINVHLKYLWCAGFVKEPPHCPIDGIIRDKLRREHIDFSYNWIRSNDIQEYNAAVEILRQQAKDSGQKKIAQWELTEFRRRNDT